MGNELGKSGELEWWKGFELLIKKNVQTIGNFTQQTRKEVVELRKEVQELKDMTVSKDQSIAELKGIVSQLQAKMYMNGMK